MKTYQIVAVVPWELPDRPLGLLEVSVPLTGTYEDRFVLEQEMDSRVELACRTVASKEQLVDVAKFFDELTAEMEAMGYSAERVFLPEVYV